MLQFTLNPLSSVLLCCTTLTDFVLLILKCKMPFLLINILDLVVRGRPCVSCSPYFVSVPKMNSACSWDIRVCLCWLQAVFISLVTHAIFCKLSCILFLVRRFALSFSKRRIRAPLGARAYPWILSKYFLTVRASVRPSVCASVPLQISVGCVYFV